MESRNDSYVQYYHRQRCLHELSGWSGQILQSYKLSVKTKIKTDKQQAYRDVLYVKLGVSLVTKVSI